MPLPPSTTGHKACQPFEARVSHRLRAAVNPQFVATSPSKKDISRGARPGGAQREVTHHWCVNSRTADRPLSASPHDRHSAKRLTALEIERMRRARRLWHGV